MSKSPTNSNLNLTELFDQFIAGTTLRSVLNTYHRICQILDLKPGRFNDFYPALKKGITCGNRVNKNWKSQSIFSKIERKASQRVYQSSSAGPSPAYGANSQASHRTHYHTATSNSNALLQSHNCLIVGGGPCGLRTAIELQLLGANHVVVIEKRDRFSRNNVLHLWPFVISDLKQLAGKKFYGKFCAGSIDHVSIRQLQLMLIKIALIIGCEFIDNIAFEEICPRNLSSSRSCSKHTSSSASSNGSLQSSGCSNSPNSATSKRRLSFCCEVVETGSQKSSDDEKKDSESEKNSVSGHPSDFGEEREEELEKKAEDPSDGYSNGTTKNNRCSKGSPDRGSRSKSSTPEKEKCQCCCHRHRSTGTGANEWSDMDPNYIGAYAHFSATWSSLASGTVFVDYDALLHKLHRYSFDILIGADGRRNTLSDNFPRKEFRGRLAIAITANFINTHTLAEAQIPEISGISFIYNQQLFKALYDDTGIDLENICYYKDDTHYFVMTAKKCSLLERGVLLKDYADTTALLAPSNINRTQLLNYARDAARWTTGYEPLNFALNHYGEADVAMFDFTSMYAAENACRAKRIIRYSPNSCICDINNSSANGHHPCKKIKSDPSKCCTPEEEGLLLIGLVGDSLLEPFWPTGSGCGRGFLSSMDAAWMVRQWEIHRCKSLEDEDEILKVLSERESIYRLLGQTTSENLSQNYAAYTINPITRYPNLNASTLLPHQCKYLLYEDPFPSPEMRRKRTLAFKRLRRATIATTTPFTADEEKTPQDEIPQATRHEVQSFEESLAAFEENYEGLISNVESQDNNIMSSSVPAAGKLFQQAGYDLSMSPSATTMAQLGKSRAKDIESALRHRRQREQLLKRTDDAFYTHKAAEQQFNSHIQSQLKHKAAWFLDPANSSNGSRSCSSSNPVKEVSRGLFSSRVKDLEAKLYAASGLSYSENRKSNPIKLPSTKSGSHVMATASTLEQLFDPKNREKELKEKVKKTIDKEIKFVGKLGADDWNFKCWQEKEKDKVTPPLTPKSPEPLPKERVDLFKKQLVAMQTKLENIDEKHHPERREAQTDMNGEWINLLKGELKERASKDNKAVKEQIKDAQEIKENIQKVDTNVRDEKRSSKQCTKCKNPVAPVDKIVFNGFILHRSCLTCSRCGVTLRLSEIRSKTMTECLSADNRAKDKTADYICILCSKNKANNNTLPSDITNSVNENQQKPSATIRPVPPPALPIKNTPLLTADEYEARIKERIRWKESFLLNNNNIDLRSKETKSEESKPEPSVVDAQKKSRTGPEPKKLTERIEYENTSMSFELFDEDELTKLLNLESDQWDSEEEEESSSDSGSWEQSDSTDNDFDSDEFDVSEHAEANKAQAQVTSEPCNRTEKPSQPEQVNVCKKEKSTEVDAPRPPVPCSIKLPIEHKSEKDTDDTSVASKRDGTKDVDQDIDSINDEVEDIVTPVNAIKEFNFVLKALQQTGDDEKTTSSRNSSISSVSCKAGFDDINLVSVVDEQTSSPKKETKILNGSNLNVSSPKQTYFKVALPKLTVFNFENVTDKPGLQTVKSFTPTNGKPPTSATYSKIPVLAARVSAAAATGTTNTSTSSGRLPAYSGSFTEKMLLRCRSSPSLNQKDVFSRWSTASSLSSNVSPSIDKSRFKLDSKAPFSYSKPDKKESPETPSVSKLPFADSDATSEDIKTLKTPKPYSFCYPVCRTIEAPKASIDEDIDEEDKITRQLKTKTDNVDDENLMRQWFTLKYKE